MNPLQPLNKKLRYRCVEVKIWTDYGEDAPLWFSNKLVNQVGNHEFVLCINTQTQEFRPGRYYWINIEQEPFEQKKWGASQQGL